MKLEHRVLLVALLVAAVPACAKRTEKAPPPAGADVIRAEVAPTASASASAPAPAPEAPRARITAARLPLGVFHVSRYQVPERSALPPEPEQVKLRIFDLGGRMVVTPTFNTLSEGKLADEAGAGFDPDEFPGLDAAEQTAGANWLEVRSLVGVYPEDLWVEGRGTWGYIGARTAGPVEHDYVWQRVYKHWDRGREAPVAAAVWSHGRVLAYLEYSHFALAHPRKGKLGEVPRPARVDGGTERIVVGAMAALPSGEVMTAGRDTASGDRLALEVWDHDEGDALAQSRVVALPAPEGKTLERVWLFASKARTLVVARYSEGAFAAEILPGEGARALPMPEGRLLHASVARDGTLFVVSGLDLYRREADGGFSMAASPVKLSEINGLFAETKEHAYVSALTEDKQSIVLWTGEAKEELPAKAPAPTPPGSATPAAELLATFPALTAACSTPFVVFFPVSRATGPTFAFPQTRATLKGFARLPELHVVDFRTGGTRYVGASAPDLATANALVEHWDARDAKSKSRAACFAPPGDARALAMP